MAQESQPKASAYDKYINYKKFGIAVAAFMLILMIPVPESMLDVAVEYTVGEQYVLDFYTQKLFETPADDAEQWQLLTARALEGCMMQGALNKEIVMKRSLKQLKGMGIETSEKLYERYHTFISTLEADRFLSIMQEARTLRLNELNYAGLTPGLQ